MSETDRVGPDHEMPVVSVVIPCFNAAATILETLESVTAQTYASWEAVIINDGSTDDTTALVEGVQAGDDRIHLINVPLNEGLSSARNRAIRAARGAFIKFLDADDRLTPDALGLMVDRARERPECAGVYASWIHCYPDGRQRAWPVAQEHALSFETLVSGNRLHIQAVMLRKTVIEEAGLFFDEGFVDYAQGAEDWDVWIRLYRCGYRLARLNTPVALYRERADSMSHDHLSQWRSGCHTLDLAFVPDARCPKALPEFAEGPPSVTKTQSQLAWNTEHLKGCILEGDVGAVEGLIEAIRVKALPFPSSVELAHAMVFALKSEPEGFARLTADWPNRYRCLLCALRAIRRATMSPFYVAEFMAAWLACVPHDIDPRPMLAAALRHGGVSWLQYLRRRSHWRELERNLCRERPSERRVAIVCDWVPYPVRSGDNKRTAEMIDVLRQKGWCVHLVLTRPLTRKSQKRLCLTHADALHVFFGGNLLGHAFRFAVRKVDGLLFHLKLPPLRDTVSRLLGRQRHLAVALFSQMPTYQSGFKEYLAKLAIRHEWNAVVINYQWLYPSIEALPPSVVTLLDTIDLQHKRVEQFESRDLNGVHAITRAEEAETMRGFDAILAIQEEEAGEIRQMCPGHAVITVGTSSPPPPPRDVPLRPYSLFYVGGANAANIDGLRHFLDRCWPRICAARPDAELRVCGHVYQAFLGESRDRVTFLGHVDDVELEYAQAAVVINPIWVGTGLKIKTVEALARAKPLVTTQKGIEGMSGNPDAACRVVDGDEAFVDAVVQLVATPSACRDLAREAATYRDQFLSPDVVYRELFAFLDENSSR
ncbi:MAG: glycosyltransferase [Verrucomicrobia bacterium]|jgi:GT2 family glycosyltransferase/glycosyltransferase involved in cell wall biosynthesis|nr:glycosyltransferase [Verrucomicrobiota bacterium]MBT7067822.1 glycosyltransferase [Verrucomicrobiota bacterium]MBT7701966.1 glycosyltransferase [Verrucomicrobiota bacterium]